MRPIILKATFFIFSVTFFVSSCETPYSYYGTWDGDDDKVIVEEEFRSVFSSAEYFKSGDLDRNSYIDEEEWKEGIITYIPNYDFVHHGNFEDWDQNADDVLNEAEFSQGTFKLWDSNGDGEIDESEYEAWHYDVD